MALHRDDVIRAAVELLDEVGLDKLTTRALTNRLGVRPGALYWHVRSKRELLAAIAHEIMREAYGEPPDPGDWVEQATFFAHRLRRAMLAHRDGARLVAGSLALNTDILDATERSLARMVAAGLSLDQSAHFGHAVASYVIGFVLQEQAVPAEAEPPQNIDPGRYPHLREWQARQPDEDQAFTAGLSLIVKGLLADLASAGKPAVRGAAPGR